MNLIFFEGFVYFVSKRSAIIVHVLQLYRMERAVENILFTSL